MIKYTTGKLPFPNRPIDEFIYCYPHHFQIEFKETQFETFQRHIWYWNDGKVMEQDWITTYRLSETYKKRLKICN